MAVYSRPDSRFYWYTLEGTQLRRSTGVPVHGGSPQQDKELRRQAEQIYAAEQAKVAQTRAGLIVARPLITFTEYLRWYEPHIAAHHRGYAKGRSMLKRLRTTFGPLPLSAIQADTVLEWMTARKKSVKPATVNRELDVLKAVLSSAVPKYLDRSPLGNRSPLGIVRRLRVPEQEPRILTREEEATLLDAADDELRAIVIVALDTLLRLSNVAFLKWAQVKPRIIVPLDAKVAHDMVPVTARMRDALDQLPQRSVYVFPGLHEKGKGPTAAKNILIRQFDALCQSAGLPHGRAAHGLTFHCLRHTGASRALQAGASVRTVMKLGGWKDLRSVLRYTHASDADVQAAAESIGPITLPARPKIRSIKPARRRA
jgi:integrase